jgi:branched-chain amino acid transport system permease protein
LGALFMAALPEILRPLANYRLLFYGGLIVLIARFQPQGLFGDNPFLFRKIFGKSVAPAAEDKAGTPGGRK